MKRKMTKCKNIKKLNGKKNFSEENKNIAELVHIKNNFCYSIIYKPMELWREPLNNYSLALECLSSVKIEESGIVNYFISSLQAKRENFKNIYKREINNIYDHGIINKSEFKFIK